MYKMNDMILVRMHACIHALKSFLLLTTFTYSADKQESDRNKYKITSPHLIIIL
jgi:hypothetical protein